jgi:hypothetical protein
MTTVTYKPLPIQDSDFTADLDKPPTAPRFRKSRLCLIGAAWFAFTLFVWALFSFWPHKIESSLAVPDAQSSSVSQVDMSSNNGKYNVA